MNRQTLSLILVLALVILGPLAIDMFLPSIPQMTTLFGVSEADIQVTIPLYILSLGLGQLIAGPISDRYGRRASGMIGLAIYSVASVLAALSSSIEMLYAARVAQGTGAAFTMVTTLAWIRDNYDGEAAGKWLSYMSGTASTMPMIAPMIGGLLALLWGWQAGFYFMAIVAALFFIAIWLTLQGRTSPAEHEQEDTGTFGENLKRLFGSSQFLIYGLANLTTFGALITYISTAPIVAITEGGFDEIGFATIFGLIGLLMIVTSFSAPKLVKRIGQRPTVTLGLSIVVLAGIGMIFVRAGATGSFFVIAAIGTMGFNLMIGTSTALLLEPFARSAGLAAAIEGCARMFGGAIIAASVATIGLKSAQALGVAFSLSLLPLIFVVKDLLTSRLNAATATRLASETDAVQ